MITWEDYNNIELPEYLFTNKEKTNIACPKCKAALFRRTDIVLASYPPQSQYECEECGWVGYSYR